MCKASRLITGLCFLSLTLCRPSNADVITFAASEFENGSAGGPATPDANGVATGTIVGTDLNTNGFLELSELQSWSFTTSNFATASLNFNITEGGPSPDLGGSGKFSLATGLPDGFVYFANNGYPEITLQAGNFILRNPVSTFQTSAYSASVGASAAVPEPSTFALLGMGTASIFTYRRRKRNQPV